MGIAKHRCCAMKALVMPTDMLASYFLVLAVDHLFAKHGRAQLANVLHRSLGTGCSAR